MYSNGDTVADPWCEQTLTYSARFTSGVTPANLLAASMVLLGLKIRSYHAAAHNVYLTSLCQFTKYCGSSPAEVQSEFTT